MAQPRSSATSLSPHPCRSAPFHGRSGCVNPPFQYVFNFLLKEAELLGLVMACRAFSPCASCPNKHPPHMTIQPVQSERNITQGSSRRGHRNSEECRVTPRDRYQGPVQSPATTCDRCIARIFHRLNTMAARIVCRSSNKIRQSEQQCCSCSSSHSTPCSR